jgi:hypothetical protein
MPYDSDQHTEEMKFTCSSHLAWPKYRKFSIFDSFSFAGEAYAVLNGLSDLISWEPPVRYRFL